MRKIVLIALLIIFSSCTRRKNSVDNKLPGNDFVNALLSHDTTFLKNILDSVSLKYLYLYSIPYLKNKKNLHYKLIISKYIDDGILSYRYVIVFPWKEVTIFYIVSTGENWSLLPVYVLSNIYKHHKIGNVTLYYPSHLNYNNSKVVQDINKWVSDFKKEVCHTCKSCCPDSLIYIYDPVMKPSRVFGELDAMHDKYYKRGLCFTGVPFDSFGVLESLLDHDKYLYSIVKGYYLYKYTDHKVLGYDIGDWLKSEIIASSIRYFNMDIIENMLFYKPVAGAFGYVFIDYLKRKHGLSDSLLIYKLFNVNPELMRIVQNQGSNILFLRKYAENIVDTDFVTVFSQLANFIQFYYNNISRSSDTIRFIRDRKRNLTFVLSTKYKRKGTYVINSFQAWIDSLNFFHKPYYTFLLVPAWLADSFRSILTPANSYWTALFEYKKKTKILDEMKREYSIYLVSNFIKTYSIQQKQLPLWVSLGVPLYFQRGSRCRIDNYSGIFKLPEYLVKHFYEASISDISPSVSIWLSYKMLCIIDHLHPGSVPMLLERSISNVDFKTTYEKVTGKDISEVFSAWKSFVDDTLFYRVSRK